MRASLTGDFTAGLLGNGVLDLQEACRLKQGLIDGQ